MRFDSEEQRNTVIKMVSNVRVSVSMQDIGAQKAEWDQLLKAMVDADLEPPPKIVVPIGVLAPDTPNRIRSFEGMPELPGENGA